MPDDDRIRLPLIPGPVSNGEFLPAAARPVDLRLADAVLERAGAAADRPGVDRRRFTIGSDISFRAHQCNPSTSQGKRLLAHELTHVVQQGASISAAPPFRLTPASDPGERAADQVAADLSSPEGARNGVVVDVACPVGCLSHLGGRLDILVLRSSPPTNGAIPALTRAPQTPP